MEQVELQLQKLEDTVQTLQNRLTALKADYQQSKEKATELGYVLKTTYDKIDTMIDRLKEG